MGRLYRPMNSVPSSHQRKERYSARRKKRKADSKEKEKARQEYEDLKKTANGQKLARNYPHQIPLPFSLDSSAWFGMPSSFTWPGICHPPPTTLKMEANRRFRFSSGPQGK
jgi:hypothetical protein